MTGLDPNADYELGIKVSDEVGNTSPLSNVVGATTFAPGTVSVSIDAPREMLPSSTSTTSTIDVRLDVDEIANFNAASYGITFDPAVLQIESVGPGLIGGTPIPVDLWNEAPAGTVNIVQDLPGVDTAGGVGYLATLTFNVVGPLSSTSAIGSSNELLSDHLGTPIPSFWTGASATVVDVLSGDANGDGVVNALDLTKIKRIIVQLDPPTPGADANHDGDVNALDLVRTKRIIVGLY